MSDLFGNHIVGFPHEEAQIEKKRNETHLACSYLGDVIKILVNGVGLYVIVWLKYNFKTVWFDSAMAVLVRAEMYQLI